MPALMLGRDRPTQRALLALEKFADMHLPAHHGLVMLTYTSASALLVD